MPDPVERHGLERQLRRAGPVVMTPDAISIKERALPGVARRDGGHGGGLLRGNADQRAWSRWQGGRNHTDAGRLEGRRQPYQHTGECHAPYHGVPLLVDDVLRPGRRYQRSLRPCAVVGTLRLLREVRGNRDQARIRVAVDVQ
jgi:hypothetical protein